MTNPTEDDPNRELRAKLAHEFSTGYQWTPQDVETMAQSYMDDTLPMELLQKLGPFPSDGFLDLLGKRVAELVRERKEKSGDHDIS